MRTGPRGAVAIGRGVAVAIVLAIAAATGSCSGGASPSPVSSAAITVSGAWVRAAPDVAQATAAYLVIANAGPTADALLAVRSPGAMAVQIHETAMDASGMMGMHPVARVDVPAGGSVTLAPGGFHLMVMGLKSPLKVGDRLELDLSFDHAGSVIVQAEVRQG
jgi:copper(I)-binding protein